VLASAHEKGVGWASAAVFLSASLWGVYWVPIRYFGGKGIDGTWTLVLMNLPAALVLTVFVVATWRTQRPYLGAALLVGLGTGLGLACYGLGIVYGSVIRATLLFYLTPVWSTLIGLVWLGERPGWQRWVAIALGLAGLGALVAGNVGIPLNGGDVLAVFSGIFWAIGGSLIKRAGRIPMGGMSMAQYWVLCLSVMGFLLVAGPRPMPDAAVVIGLVPVFMIISLALILPGVALIFWASQFLFPGRVGLLMMSEVLVAVVTASIFLPDERLALLQWLGAALIVGASIVELLPSRRRRGRGGA